MSIIYCTFAAMFRKRQIIETMYIMMTVIVAGIIAACTPRSVREAQHVVQQADSLGAEGKMCGIDAGDSASLAQAYETLQEHSAFSRQLAEVCPFVHCTSLLRTYSHACYHYGKLLRAKENPVEAMQAFISATHSRTRDYHILGRVYNNIGDICHLAGDYQLSYDMFERSAEMYLINGDSLLYYYCINDMAFELAQQGKKGETLTLLAAIENQCSNKNLLAKTWETKAELYLLCTQQYDSAIYYADKIHQTGAYESNGLLIKAQAFSLMSIRDSATYYAEQVLNQSIALGELNNALYILTNDDETKEKTEIRQTAADRSDIQKLLEIRQGKLSQAVQLLAQDLNREPDWRWLYVLIAIVLFAVSFTILYYIWRKRKEHQQIMAELQVKEEVHAQLEQTISDLSQLQEARQNQILQDVEAVCELLHNSSDIRTELCWNNYMQMCTIVNRRLYSIAERLQSFSLSEKEVRLCILVLLHSSTKQMVDMIPYSQSGLGKFKNTTARKLGTTTANLRPFLLNLAY